LREGAEGREGGMEGQEEEREGGREGRREGTPEDLNLADVLEGASDKSGEG
jgi:hypothetical protein